LGLKKVTNINLKNKWGIMKTVEEVMEQQFEVKGEDSTVSSAVKVLAEKKERTLLIASKTDILGIVTTTDIIYKVIAKDKDPKKTKLSEIMSSPVHAIGPGNTLQEAAELMTKHKIKKLPVINEQGEILGIITVSDIIAEEPEEFNTLINLEVPVEKVKVGS
jgi:CBS domain-containing protein